MLHRRPVQLFNTFQKKKTLIPEASLVRPLTWYQCGPTVYDEAHIGHARTYVSMDVLRRLLRQKGYCIRQAINITDIDDKIIARSMALGLSHNPRILTRHHEQGFRNEMQCLDVIPPDHWLRVSDYMPHMISYIKALVERELAYVASDGSVLFDISKYNQLTSASSLITGYGVFRPPPPCMSVKTSDGDDRKRNSADFALWKSAPVNDTTPDGAFYYPAPWSRGRPGWHLECSVMSQAIFGQQLDLHSGGIDLQFPHHENEVAQCRAMNLSSSPDSTDWCTFFIHSGHITMGSEKMGKSLGNSVKISDYVKEHGALHLRLLCLIARYSSPLDVRSDGHVVSINNLQSLLQKTFQALVESGISPSTPSLLTNHSDLDVNNPFYECIDSALCDDLNTSVVLNEVLPRLCAEIQRQLGFGGDIETLKNLSETLYHTCDMLGVKDLVMQSILSDDVKPREPEDKSKLLKELLLETRVELRQVAAAATTAPASKSDIYRISDRIRHELERLEPNDRITDKRKEG